MSDMLRIAFTVSAVLTGVLLALDLIALLESRYHITAWMRHQEEINRSLRHRVEQLERLSPPRSTPYSMTLEDIDTLKDAAALFGPGEPIARDLWRLAERAEGKR